MKDSVNFGPNKTGIQMAPILSKEMEAGTEEISFAPHDSTVSPNNMRSQYIRETGPVGSVPMPGTVKGAMNTVLQKIKGNHPVVLVDKLGERLAFERTGVRLYDALLAKCETALPNMPLDTLRSFREEELEHYFMLMDVIEKIGADPTAQTPCADSSGVAAQGLLQVLSDPRMTVPQCVEAILIAELADNDGWDLLIRIASEVGMDAEARAFRIAKLQEEKHLDYIRRWLEHMTLENKAVVHH
jgi:bacterioferritin (cytochrome b1)